MDTVEALHHTVHSAPSSPTGAGGTFIHPDGDEISLRLVFNHLIAEYARHNGHADLLRQCIDGVTGS